MSKISRRDFVKLSAVGFGSILLVACGASQKPALAAGTAAPTATVLPGSTNPPATGLPAIAAPTTASGAGNNGKGQKNNTAKAGKGQRDGNNPTSGNPAFIATEITGRPTNSSITANIVPAVAMSLYYEYGTETGKYAAKTSAQTGAVWAPIETLIDGLQPNTRYYYRLNYNGTPGPEHTCVTQRAPGSTFTFDIQGDSHPERLGKQFDPALYTRTLQSAASDKPDFYICIGDDFSVDTLKTVNAQTVSQGYINQRQWLNQVGAPVFLVNGNHEQAAMSNLDGTADNVAVWAQLARNGYYPQPAPDTFFSGDNEPVQHIGPLRDYYSFTWGDALFVMLDQYWHSPVTVDNQFGADHDNKSKRDLWQVTIGDTQYQWFKQVLASSSAKYKFVFSHHVLGTQRGGIEVASNYEWGDARNLASHRPTWDKTIHQVMVDNHVNIYFQGHDHIFVRQELDGVIYQTLPEPANPFYTAENSDSYRSGDKFPNSGHVRVTVAPAAVSVDYVRSYLDKPDELAFSYKVS